MHKVLKHHLNNAKKEGGELFIIFTLHTHTQNNRKSCDIKGSPCNIIILHWPDANQFFFILDSVPSPQRLYQSDLRSVNPEPASLYAAETWAGRWGQNSETRTIPKKKKDNNIEELRS